MSYYTGNPEGDALRFFADQEASHERACIETARSNGHDATTAENCDDGSVGCPNCPFKRAAS